jgi:hypothetical protein
LKAAKIQNKKFESRKLKSKETANDLKRNCAMRSAPGGEWQTLKCCPVKYQRQTSRAKTGFTGQSPVE